MGAEEWWAEAELAEARATSAMNVRAPAGVREALGMAAAEVGGGYVTVMANDPTGGVWNRAIGLGVRNPVTGEAVDRATEFAQEHGAPLLVVQVSPRAEPAGWESVLESRGLSPSATWAKLACPAGQVVPGVDASVVEELGPADADEFAGVLLTGFEMDAGGPQREWLAGLAASAGPWRSYGVRRGGSLVAVGWMFAEGATASLLSAATLPEHRREGLHQAVIARRVMDAAAAGCTLVATETASDTEANPNPAVRSLEKAGLVPLYQRRNWIWRQSQ